MAADAVYVSVSKAAAPSKLKIKSKSKNSIKIGWKAASKATSYEIYRSTSKSKKYKKVATVSASKKTFKDKKLKKNKKYYYKVRAVRKGYINSSFSNIVSTKTKKIVFLVNNHQKRQDIFILPFLLYTCIFYTFVLLYSCRENYTYY